MKLLKILCFTIGIIGMLSALSFGQTKLAQTGFNFLDITSDARSSAMGNAVNSLSGFSGALFHNPASMAEMPTLVNATFSMNTWIADINYMSASLMLSPFDGDYGAIGLSLQAIDYGEIEGTVVDRTNPNGYRDTKIHKPTAFAIGVGYAAMISEQFGVGAQVKYASQVLGESTIMTSEGDVSVKENKANAIAFDFGTIYKTGIKSLAFGMSVRNFSKEVKYEEEGFQLPLLFIIGVSANVFDFFESPIADQGLILSVDATHPRSLPEQIKVGVEYQFMKIISLRAGYISGDHEYGFNYGVGVSYFGFEFDYAYTPFGLLGDVQRFTARFSL